MVLTSQTKYIKEIEKLQKGSVISVDGFDITFDAGGISYTYPTSSGSKATLHVYDTGKVMFSDGKEIELKDVLNNLIDIRPNSSLYSVVYKTLPKNNPLRKVPGFIL